MADKASSLKASEAPPTIPPSNSIFMQMVGLPLVTMLEKSKVDEGFAVEIMQRFLPIVREYAGRNYEEELSRGAQMAPPRAPAPRNTPQQRLHFEAEAESTPRHNLSANLTPNLLSPGGASNTSLSNTSLANLLEQLSELQKHQQP